MKRQGRMSGTENKYIDQTNPYKFDKFKKTFFSIKKDISMLIINILIEKKYFFWTEGPFTKYKNSVPDDALFFHL